MPKPRLLTLTSLALGAAVFTSLVAGVWPFTVDDAFITLRYAQNLAAGEGPTYNAGLPPVEGNTTFLWMLLLALPHLLGVDAVLFAKCMGVAAALASSWVGWRLARRLIRRAGGAGEGTALAAPLWLACFPPTAVHAVSGMETALFTLLLLVLVERAAAHLEAPSPGTDASLAITALLLGLTRPEGNLVSAAALGVALALAPAGRRGPLARAAALLYILPGAAYFVWRVLYYGHLLPLSFHLKVLGGGGLAGAATVLAFARLMALHVGILVLLGAARSPRATLPVLLPAAALLLFYLFPAPIMSFHWRYLYPAAPLLFAAAAVGLAALTGWIRRRAPQGSALPACAAVALAALIGASLLADAPRVLAGRRAYARGLAAAHVTLGVRLAGFRPAQGRPTLAMADAGAAPYFSRWRSVDTFGLNDAAIARTGRRDPDDVLSKRPDVVVLVSRRADGFEPFAWNAWEAPLLRACLARGMARVLTLEFHPGAYYLWVLAQPGSGAHAHLSAGSG